MSVSEGAGTTMQVYRGLMPGVFLKSSDFLSKTLLPLFEKQVLVVVSTPIDTQTVGREQSLFSRHRASRGIISSHR